VDYHVKWLEGARDSHGLGDEFVMGQWNERSYSIDWTIELRKQMDAAGFSNSRVSVADKNWDVVKDLVKNKTFLDAVDILGVHYPDSSKELPPPADALSLGLPLWASEFWDLSKVADWEGALRLAQNINDNYVVGSITGHIIWNTVFSWYAILPFSHPDNTTSGAGHSVVAAAEPWSGHWQVSPTAYAAAHTTQFAMPGWHYLNQSSISGEHSGAGTLPGGGTYLTLVSGDGRDFSIVIVTAGARAQQNVTLQLKGAPAGTGRVPIRTPLPALAE